MSDGSKVRGAGLRFRPFAKPGTGRAPQADIVEGAADPPAEDDLPAIEQFLDELPSIDDYLAADIPPVAEVAPHQVRAFEVPSGPIEAEGWAVAAWQSYDWSSLASLGRQSAEMAEAESSWNATDWAGGEGEVEAQYHDDAGGGWSSHADGPSADEIAAALDAIAVRIRSGELAIEQFRGIPPEAAMAAALAAMLRLRR